MECEKPKENERSDVIVNQSACMTADMEIINEHATIPKEVGISDKMPFSINSGFAVVLVGGS